MQTWISGLTLGFVAATFWHVDAPGGAVGQAFEDEDVQRTKASMISLTAEYALRAVVWIAGRPGVAVGARAIAGATQVPGGYMSKVLQALARAGLVQSRPGRSGGFILGRDPRKISVLEVVQAVDPIRRIAHCPLGRRHGNGELCPLHRRLDQAIGMVERAFADSSLAELVAEGQVQDALCAASSAMTRAPNSAGGQPRPRGRPARSARQR